MLERWRKLERDFFKKDSYDTRKVPDIYDCIKFDYLHNQQVLKLATAPILYEAIAPLAALVNPQEYGNNHTVHKHFGQTNIPRLKDLRRKRKETLPYRWFNL